MEDTVMINVANIRAAETDLAFNDIFILVKAGAPGATDGVGMAGKGSLCIDSSSGKLYSNTGTKAAPTWTVAGLQT
jgi:hypothetical protein